MTHFVIAYDRKLERMLERADFADDQRVAALAEHDRLLRKYLRDPNVEVVVLGSRSEADLRVTHGRYFAPLPPASL